MPAVTEGVSAAGVAVGGVPRVVVVEMTEAGEVVGVGGARRVEGGEVGRCVARVVRVDELEDGSLDGETPDDGTEVAGVLVVVTSVPGSPEVVVRAAVASGW